MRDYSYSKEMVLENGEPIYTQEMIQEYKAQRESIVPGVIFQPSFNEPTPHSN